MPPVSVVFKIPGKSARWNMGEACKKISSGPISKATIVCNELVHKLVWLSMTPLGSPVLPLEKTTVASLSKAGVPAAAQCFS